MAGSFFLGLVSFFSFFRWQAVKAGLVEVVQGNLLLGRSGAVHVEGTPGQEDRINGWDQWVISPTYKWRILGLVITYGS